MSEPKRHHYVPQFYLKSFANDREQIWVYDRKTREYRQQSVKDTAVQQNYYRVRTKDGKHSTEIEKFFSQVEGLACAAMSKLERGEELTEEERGNIALFVSFQMTRVPDFEKRMNEADEKLIKRMNKMSFHSVEAAKAVLDKLNKDTGDDGNDVSPEEMYEFIQQERYTVQFPRERMVRTMLELGYDLARYFVQMDWLLLRTSKEGSFVTSDNPYTLFPPEDYDPNTFWGSAVGILTPGAKKAIPISSDTSLFMCDHGGRLVETVAPRDKIRAINAYYARSSDRFIFAKDEALLRSVVERSRVDEIPFDRERTIVG